MDTKIRPKGYCVLLRASASAGDCDSEYEYFFKVYGDKAEAFEDASVDPTDSSWKSGISIEEDLSRGDESALAEAEAQIEAFYKANEDAASRIREGDPEINYPSNLLGYCFDGVMCSRCVDVLFADYWPKVANDMMDFVESTIGLSAEENLGSLCEQIDKYVRLSA